MQALDTHDTIITGRDTVVSGSLIINGEQFLVLFRVLFVYFAGTGFICFILAARVEPLLTCGLRTRELTVLDFVADRSLEQRPFCVNSTYDQSRSGHELRR
jgi:hypothetical protein